MECGEGERSRGEEEEKAIGIMKNMNNMGTFYSALDSKGRKVRACKDNEINIIKIKSEKGYSRV
jgi:hypothetical protein